MEDRFSKDVRIYQNRSELVPIEQIFDKANSELIIWVACLGTLIQYLGTITKKLEQNCEVKILLMSQVDSDGKKNRNIELNSQISMNSGFEHRLEIAHTELAKFYNSLDEKSKKNIEIKTYLHFHTATYLLIDRQLKSGFVRFEPNLFGFYLDELPSFEIHANSKSSLYNVILRSFSKEWDNAAPFLDQ